MVNGGGLVHAISIVFINFQTGNWTSIRAFYNVCSAEKFRWFNFRDGISVSSRPEALTKANILIMTNDHHRNPILSEEAIKNRLAGHSARAFC
jgi:hypothetical protein